MKIGFYPGCSLQGTAREYNESVKAIASAFDIDMHEIDDWNCCGASAAHAVNKNLSLALPARILALAEKQGFEEIVVPCAACFNRLAVAQYEIEKDDQLKKSVEQSIKMTFNNSVKILVRHDGDHLAVGGVLHNDAGLGVRPAMPVGYGGLRRAGQQQHDDGQSHSVTTPV